MVKGAVFLALIVLATGCRHKDEPLKPLVIVDKPAKEDVQIFGEYVGRIRAARFVEIHARVEGYLEKMLFVEGKEVKQNEPLFIINSALYKAKVEKAKAQLKKNEAQAAKAKRDVERLQPLYEQHAASQLDLDNALASLGDAEADIAMSKADLDQAQLELSYTTVTSPLAGYISERFVDVGALVGPGVNSKLAAVVKSDTVLVDFKMTALDYLRAERRNIKFGEQDTSRSWQPTVTVTLADDSEYPVKGPARTMILPTGCWASSRRRTPRPWPTATPTWKPPQSLSWTVSWGWHRASIMGEGEPPSRLRRQPPLIGGPWHCVKFYGFAKAAPIRGGGIAKQ